MEQQVNDFEFREIVDQMTTCIGEARELFGDEPNNEALNELIDFFDNIMSQHEPFDEISEEEAEGYTLDIEQFWFMWYEKWGNKQKTVSEMDRENSYEPHESKTKELTGRDGSDIV